jgi:hypothetical protein
MAGALKDQSSLPPTVLRMDPRDGATGVFRDAPVVVSLSHGADARTLGPETFRVEEAGRGPVPGRLRLSPDGSVLIWKAERLLTAGVEHVVTACGVRDARGREVAPHRSRFVPCDLVMDDVVAEPGARGALVSRERVR